jgi:serine/threonine protein phosphatase PrpC
MNHSIHFDFSKEQLSLVFLAALANANAQTPQNNGNEKTNDEVGSVYFGCRNIKEFHALLRSFRLEGESVVSVDVENCKFTSAQNTNEFFQRFISYFVLARASLQQGKRPKVGRVLNKEERDASRKELFKMVDKSTIRYEDDDRTVLAATTTMIGMRSAQQDKVCVFPCKNGITADDLVGVLEDCYREVRRKARGGTTALIAKVEGRKAEIVNVGDSRAVIIARSKNGRLICKRVTCDHSLNDLFEIARVNFRGGVLTYGEDKAWRVNGGLNMTRSLESKAMDGISSQADMVLIDLEKVLNPDEFAPDCEASLLLATDGLYDCLGEEDIKDILASMPKGTSIEVALQRLRDISFAERGSQDNTSAVMVKFGSKKPIVSAVFDGHGTNSNASEVACNALMASYLKNGAFISKQCAEFIDQNTMSKILACQEMVNNKKSLVLYGMTLGSVFFSLSSYSCFSSQAENLCGNLSVCVRCALPIITALVLSNVVAFDNRATNYCAAL